MNEVRRVRLTPADWFCAVAISVLRNEAHPKRSAGRDRGAKNLTVDIQGAIGELVAIKRAESVHSNVQHDLNQFNGGVRAPDIRIDGVFLDVKCLLWNPTKKFFLIDKAAHQRSWGISYYPVISTLGSWAAIVGPVIEKADVDTWSEWGNPAAARDPMLCLRLEQFSDGYLNHDWSVIVKEILPTIVDHDTLTVVYPEIVAAHKNQIREEFALSRSANEMVLQSSQWLRSAAVAPIIRNIKGE